MIFKLIKWIRSNKYLQQSVLCVIGAKNLLSKTNGNLSGNVKFSNRSDSVGLILFCIRIDL